MSIELTVYHPKTYQLVADLSSDVVNFSFSVGIMGDVGGNVLVELTTNNKALITSMRENSHFLVVSAGEQRHGVIIESISIRNGIATINFTGFMGYMDKVHALPSHKAGLGKMARTVGDTDKSWSKNFYSDSSAGIVYGLLHNLEKSMKKDGYNAPYDATPLLSSVGNISWMTRWEKSYRVNGLDLSSVKSAIDSALDDGSVLSVGIDTSNGFKWKIGLLTKHTVWSLGKDGYSNGEVNEGESINRTTSWAVGTDTLGRDTISRLPVNNSVAYSSYFAEGKPEGNKNIVGYNESAARAMVNSNLQVDFDMFNDRINVSDKVTIDMGILGVYTIVINQMTVEATTYSYTGQVIEVDSAGIVPGIRKATNTVRNVLYRPLHSAQKSASAALRRIRRSTGVRT